MGRVSGYLKKIVGLTACPFVRMPGTVGALTGLFSLAPLLMMAVENEQLKTYSVMAFAVSLLIAWIICLPISLVENRRINLALRSVALIVAIAIALPEAGSIAMTGSIVNSDTIALISETTRTEAKGFFEQYFTIRAAGVLLLAALIPAIFAIAFRFIFSCKVKWIQTVIATITVACIVVGSLIAGSNLQALSFNSYKDYISWLSYTGTRAYEDRFTSIHNGSLPEKMAILLYGHYLMNRHTGSWEQLQIDNAKTVRQAPDSLRFNVVMIVGESFIRVHSSLYGYALPTNQRLEAEADSGLLIAFDQTYTTANFTTPSLRNAFNLNRTDRGEEWYEGLYFPMVMKQAGWQCAHFDNQTVSRRNDNGISALFYSPLNMKFTYSAVGDSVFDLDGEFLNHTKRKMAKMPISDRQFVTYHLMGQHFPASERYSGRNRITLEQVGRLHHNLTGDELRQVYEYDNATAYNDSIVGAIIDQWSTTPTIVVYFSDHGEDLPDLGDVSARNVQRPDDPDWVDRQFHIPFMIWTSKSFRDKYPERTKMIREAAHRPLSIDTVGQFILNLCGIDLPPYAESNPKP